MITCRCGNAIKNIEPYFEDLDIFTCSECADDHARILSPNRAPKSHWTDDPEAERTCSKCEKTKKNKDFSMRSDLFRHSVCKACAKKVKSAAWQRKREAVAV